MKGRYYLSLIIFLLVAKVSIGQEFNMNVTVSAPNLKLTDPQLFKQMETSLTEFINNTKWTTDSYEQHEKIEGSIQIQIVEEYSQTSFLANFIIQAVRPVFNASYTSPLINHVDNGVAITYEINQEIERSEDSFTDNLSSVINYYLYMILGLDADSFELNGGTEHFRMAQQVISVIPPGFANGEPGWQAVGKDFNRYWFVENMLNPRVRPFRQAFYEYHRQGLDKMSEDRGRARAVIASNITLIQDVNQTFPNSMALRVFSNTKRNELVQIFDVAPPGQRKKIYNTMVKVNPILAEALKPLNK
jgi:hypothetical protein